MSSDEADRALQDPSYRFQGERFDSFDGLPGQTQAIDPFPKAIQGTDGRIWFTATKGVAWIDPKKIPRNAVPPPVSITSVSADGSHYLRLTGLQLPARTANIQIDYSALSLSVPERVRFRYKLDGIDKGWQDVDTRRQALLQQPGAWVVSISRDRMQQRRCVERDRRDSRFFHPSGVLPDDVVPAFVRGSISSVAVGFVPAPSSATAASIRPSGWRRGSMSGRALRESCTTPCFKVFRERFFNFRRLANCCSAMRTTRCRS